MILNFNINISKNFSVKYNCDISKSKWVFPLPNESYCSLIASIVKSYCWSNRSTFFLGHPVCFYASSSMTFFFYDFIFNLIVFVSVCLCIQDVTKIRYSLPYLGGLWPRFSTFTRPPKYSTLGTPLVSNCF